MNKDKKPRFNINTPQGSNPPSTQQTPRKKMVSFLKEQIQDPKDSPNSSEQEKKIKPKEVPLSYTQEGLNTLLQQKKDLQIKIKELEDQMLQRTIRLKQERHCSIYLANQVQLLAVDQINDQNIEQLKSAAADVQKVLKQYSFRTSLTTLLQETLRKSVAELTNIKQQTEDIAREIEATDINQMKPTYQMRQQSIPIEETEQFSAFKQEEQQIELQCPVQPPQTIEEEIVVINKEEEVNQQLVQVQCENQLVEESNQNQPQVEENIQLSEIQRLQNNIEESQNKLISKLLEQNQKLRRTIENLTEPTNVETCVQRKLYRNLNALHPINRSLIDIQTQITQNKLLQ